MLDSNLPTYYYRASTDKTRRFDYNLLFTQFGSEPEPLYILRHPDPSEPRAKNCYAAALFDAFIPDVLFGEVLLTPQWTQPTLSAEEIRRNGGVPPPPAPVIPEEFTIQLYNPEQQIIVTEKSSSWGGSPSYLFSIPQLTFRTPSASALDRSTHDPAANATTPHINFVWRKESKLSNNLTCFLTGKSTDTGTKKKGGKEPDIAIALLSSYRDLTVYESNLHRVEIEDYKGLEVVMLLSAAVIRDIYCGQRKDSFNVGEAPRKNSGGIMKRKKSIPMLPNSQAPALPSRPGQPTLQSNGLPMNHRQRRQSMPSLNSSPQPPPVDARTQWEIDAETARLKKQAERERKSEEAHKRERLKAEEAETKRLRKMVEAEEKERRRRQTEVDIETERLRRLYGDQQSLLSHRPPPLPHRKSPSASANHPFGPPIGHPPIMLPAQPGPYINSPYLQPHGIAPPAASSSSFFHGPGGRPKPKKSFLGLRSHGESSEEFHTVRRKRSSLF